MIGYRVRIHTLKRRGKQLEQQVKDRTKALQQEIEGRKRIEHALRESEARFRSIVETAPSMLHIADTQGKVFYVSPNCEEMTGYTQEELIVSFHSWVHADDAPKADEFYTRAFSEGIGWRNFEYKAVKKNGEIWYASSSWESFQDEDGLFAGIVMQTIDITERKHAEQELHRLYEQARQNAEIKAELLREIHHRVKNNLQMISSLLYFQAQNAEDVRLLEVLQESRNRIKSIAIVHEQLYQAENLAKIEFDSYLRSLTSYLFHVCAVSTETIALRITAEKIILTIGTAIPCALVLNELVTNALKHAFPNGRSGELQIDFHQDGDQVILRIADNGVGMPNDLNIHVVESLGLSLVMDLITKQLHGMLELDRAHGTTFTITFPLA